MSTIIRLTESELLSLVKSTARRLIRESGGFSAGSDLSDDVLGETHYEIGFANKFYTLWKVTTTKYTRTFVYIKNISFSKDRTMSLYPDAPYNEALRGKSRTFTESLVPAGGDNDFMWSFGKPHVSVQEGQPMELEQFLVQRTSVKYTRYGKPYYSIVGIDMRNPFEPDIAVNLFDNVDEANLPTQGDVLHVTGVVGFYNDDSDTIYVNKPSYEFVERSSPTEGATEDGMKIKNLPVILQNNIRAKVDSRGYVTSNGFLIFVDENGHKYIVESEIAEFRSGTLKRKFDTRGMYIGDQYELSGTIKKVNGLNKVLRAKFNLTAEAEDKEPKPRGIRKVAVRIKTFKGKEETGRSAYTFGPENLEEFYQHVWEQNQEYGGKIEVDQIPCKTYEDMVKRVERMLDPSCRTYIAYASIAIVIPQTKEKIIYTISGILDPSEEY